MKNTKKVATVSLVLVIVISLVLFAGCAAPSAPAEKVRIVVADAKTTHHLNLYVAKELGFFEKYNLDVQIVDVRDLSAARDLVVVGEADIFWSCPTVAIAAIANGAPIKIISQVKTPCTSVLVVAKDSPIQELLDLHGKNIAGISPSCEAVISLSVAARNVGSVFHLQELAGGAAIAALEAGVIDGAILEEPHVSIAEQKGFKVLFPTISENIPCRTINASNRILANNPEALKRFIKAVDEANRLILKDPIASNIVDIAIKYTGAPREAIIHGNDRLLFLISIDTEGLILLGDELVRMRNIRENPGDRLFAQEFKGVTW